MKLSQLSFNFNYQMNKQPKKTENQMRFSSLPKDTISFGVRLPENFRKKVQYESRLKPALSKEKMTNEMYELLLELIALKESYSYKKKYYFR